MNRNAFKQSAKKLIGPLYRKAREALPAPVRNEVFGYWEYHRTRHGQSPYWERREQPDATRRLVRLGFVGAGRYAQNHLKVLAQLDRVELSALLTTGGPRGQAAAREFGFKRTFTDADAFFAQSDLDAFVVVVPPEFLKGLALRGLATGKPVLLEKPPGVTAADAAELTLCAQAHGTFGMVCMNRRFFSVLEHGLAHLASCGPIRAMTVEIPQQVTRDRQSGRVSAFDHEHYFMRMSIHGVDLVRYVLGEPLSVHAVAHPNREGHNASATFATVLEFPGNAVATITDAWDTPHVWRIKITAEQGWVELEPLEHGFIATARPELHGGVQKTALRPDPVDVEFREGVYAQDLAFVEAVRAKTPPTLPACTLEDAHQTMLLMERILHPSNSSHSK